MLFLFGNHGNTIYVNHKLNHMFFSHRNGTDWLFNTKSICKPFPIWLQIFFNCFHPDNPWNDDAPFSVLPHLQDQYDTFEELQGEASVPTNQNAVATASVWGTSISKAETDNLLS